MHTNAGIRHRRLLVFVIPLFLVLALALSACGTNAPTTTGAAPASTATAPVVTATPTQDQVNTNGCPSNTVMQPPLPAASVVLTNADSGTTITAKKGDTIEIKLSFGHVWQGPMDLAQGLLTAQGPAGYAYPTAKVCIWRFLAAGTGSAHFSFEGRPICKPTQACPMYIMAVPFTVDITA